MLSVLWRHAVCLLIPGLPSAFGLTEVYCLGLLIPGLPSAFSFMEACSLLVDTWITHCFRFDGGLLSRLVDTWITQCFQFGEDMPLAIEAGGFSLAQVPNLRS